MIVSGFAKTVRIRKEALTRRIMEDWSFSQSNIICIITDQHCSGIVLIGQRLSSADIPAFSLEPALCITLSDMYITRSHALGSTKTLVNVRVVQIRSYFWIIGFSMIRRHQFSDIWIFTRTESDLLLMILVLHQRILSLHHSTRLWQTSRSEFRPALM